jgi:hypothetical protein
MFFSDPRGALKEMARAVRDDGIVAIQVWDRLEDQPAYRPFIDVAAGVAGTEATDLLGSYFSRGDLPVLEELLLAGGLRPTAMTTDATALRFGSVDAFVITEVQSTPLGERLTGDVVAEIIEATRKALRPFTSPDGSLDIPIRGHVITAAPRARSGHVTGSSRNHVFEIGHARAG